MIASGRLRLLLLGFWLLPAAVATLGLRLVPSRLNPDLTLVEILVSQLLIWLPWAVWSTLIAAVSDRVPFERDGWWRALLAHVVLSVVVVSAQIFVITTVATAFGMLEPRGFESTLVIGIRQYGDLLMVVYWAVVGTVAGLRWYARWQEETLRAAQLGEDLAHARLGALRAQLNPHFLFNSLNAVVTLIGRDAAAAQTMLVRIADLLRATLAAGDAQETSLSAELELTAKYLEIEQVRFADRLAVAWAIDSDVGALTVPAFTLQPLVENALKHGVGRRTDGGRVTISAHRDESTLTLTVHDDGPGVTSGVVHAGAGIALANLRARLERLYGSAASLELVTTATGGTDAVVRLPVSAR
jgi:signal transduction histidine kinase